MFGLLARTRPLLTETVRRGVLRPRPWLELPSVRMLATDKDMPMLNEAIQTDRVRLAIKDEKTGKSTSSIVTINEALEKARSMKLDLVLVTSQSEPWVCKLMDYKREKYNQMKKEKAKKRGQQLTKETHIKSNIGEHDLLIKLKRVTDHFGDGHAVRVILGPSGTTPSLKRPAAIQKLRDFIVDEYFVGKCKNIVEVEPAPGSLRREIILYPLRGPAQKDKGGKEQGAGGEGAKRAPSKPPKEEPQSEA